MNLPLGNPYNDLLQQKFEDKITQEQLETEIAKDVALKPEMYAYELIPPKPQKLMDFYTLSEEKQEKVWKNLQYDREIVHYNKVILEHSRNQYALKYFIDCLNDFPNEQLILKTRLSEFNTTFGQHEKLNLTETEQDVVNQWGGVALD